MVLVIPEALTLASIIWGFNEIIQWLIALRSKAITAAQHCAELLVDMDKMREWVEKIRKCYKVTAYVGKSLMGDLTLNIHGALDDVLLACKEVESLADRITSGHCKTWKALIHSSELKKKVAKLEEEKRRLEGLQASTRFAQEVERDAEREIKRNHQAKLDEKAKIEKEEIEKAESSTEKRQWKKNKKFGNAFNAETNPWDTDSSPPSYGSATQNNLLPKSSYQSRRRGDSKRVVKAKQDWAVMEIVTKTVGGAGLGGLGVVGIVALCNPVGGLAAVAGVTVYGLVAAGTLGGAAVGWAAS